MFFNVLMFSCFKILLFKYGHVFWKIEICLTYFTEV